MCAYDGVVWAGSNYKWKIDMKFIENAHVALFISSIFIRDRDDESMSWSWLTHFTSIDKLSCVCVCVLVSHGETLARYHSLSCQTSLPLEGFINMFSFVSVETEICVKISFWERNECSLLNIEFVFILKRRTIQCRWQQHKRHVSTYLTARAAT